MPTSLLAVAAIAVAPSRQSDGGADGRSSTSKHLMPRGEQRKSPQATLGDMGCSTADVGALATVDATQGAGVQAVVEWQTVCNSPAEEAPPVDVAISPSTTAAKAVSPPPSGDGERRHCLSELQHGCPAGVDPSRKQDFLVLAEFEQVFGMGVVAFSELPNWKRTKAPKTAGLF